MNIFLGFLLGIAIAVPILLGVYWVLWMLWLAVIPSIWPDGPAGVINIGYWTFTGAMILLSLIGQAIFGRSGGKQ